MASSLWTANVRVSKSPAERAVKAAHRAVRHPRPGVRQNEQPATVCPTGTLTNVPVHLGPVSVITVRIVVI